MLYGTVYLIIIFISLLYLGVTIAEIFWKQKNPHYQLTTSALFFAVLSFLLILNYFLGLNGLHRRAYEMDFGEYGQGTGEFVWTNEDAEYLIIGETE